jgi:hypothetical protein
VIQPFRDGFHWLIKLVSRYRIASAQVNRIRGLGGGIPKAFEKRSNLVRRFMTVAFVSGIIGLAMICAAIDIADAQQIRREGHRMAHAECAQCHGVDRAGISRNPAARRREHSRHDEHSTNSRAPHLASIDAEFCDQGAGRSKYHCLHHEPEKTALNSSAHPSGGNGRSDHGCYRTCSPALLLSSSRV